MTIITNINRSGRFFLLKIGQFCTVLTLNPDSYAME